MNVRDLLGQNFLRERKVVLLIYLMIFVLNQKQGLPSYRHHLCRLKVLSRTYYAVVWTKQLLGSVTFRATSMRRFRVAMCLHCHSRKQRMLRFR